MSAPFQDRTPLTLTRRTPIDLGRPDLVLYVVNGVLDVFCTPVAGDRQLFVASVGAGGALFGSADGAGVVTRARTSAEVIDTTLAELGEVCGPQAADELRAAWVRTLGLEPGDGVGDVDDAFRAARGAARSRRETDVARRSHRDALLERRTHETLVRAGRILDSNYSEPDQAREHDELLAACRLIGRVEGFAVSATPPAGDALPPLEQIANASGFRTRAVTLRAGWEREADGTLLGFLDTEEGGLRPVVLQATGGGRPTVLDPRGGPARVLHEMDATRLQATAFQLYRPLPKNRKPSALTLVRFALRGTGRDVAAVAIVGALAGALAALTPILTKIAFGSAIPAGEEGTLGVMAAGLVLAAFGAWLFGTVQGIAVVRISNRMERSLQPAVWDWVLSLPTQFFRLYAAGDLANRALGIDRIREVLTTTVISALLALVFSSFSLLTMFSFSAPLAGIALGLLVIGMLATLLNASRQLHYLSRTVELDNRTEGLLVQTLQGISKLRVAGAEDRAFSLLADLTSERERLAYRQQHLAATLSSGTTSFQAMAYAVVLLSVSSAGWVDISPPTFLAFNAAFGIVVAAALSVSTQLVAAAPVAPLYRAIVPLLEATPDVAAPGIGAPDLSGRIEVRGLAFRYGDEAPLVLDDVSFSVEPGEFVAVVGPSGSGKSSLVRLLLGFEEPLRGNIFFDDHDLSILDARAVRRQMGVVLQQSRLLSGSIYENIVGALNLTMDDAWAAAERAGVKDDIEAMPMGMHTIVTAGGGTVSGGQAQRIVIARALASSPRILLMDEATSALDNETQRHVTESLAQLGTTRIVVAHRLTTVRDADRIIVIERGRLVEQGTYDELMEAGGLFARLAHRQLL